MDENGVRDVMRLIAQAGALTDEVDQEVERILRAFALQQRHAGGAQLEEYFLGRIQHLYQVIGANPGNCRGCEAAVWWVKTKNNKSAPWNARGEPHWADCPQAERFRGR